MELVLPSIKYKDSYVEGVIEYQMIDSKDRKDLYGLNVKELKKDFLSYVTKILSQAEGKNLPEGYLPQIQYWLIDQGVFIGRAVIRPSLNETLLKEGGHIGYDIRPSKRKMGYGKKILELTLLKAKELGLDKLLITCDETNIGSKIIIERNGGIFENRLQIYEGKPAKLRYWITL